MNISTVPELPEFRVLAKDRRVIPVTRRLLADDHTAVGLFRALCGDRAGTFLLESAEPGRLWSRYSFIGVRCAAMLTERDGSAAWLGRAPRGVPDSGNPVDVLRETIRLLHTEPIPGLPPLTGGLVGYFTYDTVRRWERIPDENPDELQIPELAFLLATDLAVVDHTDGSVLLIANAINFDDSDDRVDEAWGDAITRLDSMQSALGAAPATSVWSYDTNAQADIRVNVSAEEFMYSVERAKEYIRAGDAFQIVLSQRFQTPCEASGLDVYRILRSSNPSPYMYLLRLPQDDLSQPDYQEGQLTERTAFEIVGSSPEA